MAAFRAAPTPPTWDFTKVDCKFNIFHLEYMDIFNMEQNNRMSPESESLLDGIEFDIKCGRNLSLAMISEEEIDEYFDKIQGIQIDRG